MATFRFTHTNIKHGISCNGFSCKISGRMADFMVGTIEQISSNGTEGLTALIIKWECCLLVLKSLISGNKRTTKGVRSIL